MKDKYSAIWVSHSSMSDYLRCPRAYYLRNIYRDPKTNRKISIIEPALALGQIIHDTIDALSRLPVESRFSTPLVERFETLWTNISGKKGGFVDEAQEKMFKDRALAMIHRLTNNPGPLKNKTVRL